MYRLSTFMSAAVACFVLLLAGCPSVAPTQNSPPALTSIEQRWQLKVSQADGEVAAGILEINASSSSLVPTFKPSSAAQSWSISSEEIQPVRLRISFSEVDMTYTFEGTLQHRDVLGYFQIGEDTIVPGRMVLTTAESIRDDQVEQPYARSEELKSILSSSQPLGATLAFLTAEEQDPLNLYAIEQVLQRLPGMSVSEQEVKAFVDLGAKIHARWGQPLLEKFYRQAAMTLATAGLGERLLADLIRQAREKFPEGSSASLDDVFLLTQGVSAIVSADKARQAMGAQQLQDYLARHPFDPTSRLALAEHALANEQLEDALNRFAELALLPQMEDMVRQMRSQSSDEPEALGTQVVNLWKEVKGTSEGLATFLRERYRAVTTSLAPLFPARPLDDNPRRRPVVCELFTGGGCIPCIPADLALTNLEQIYAPPTLITLRYHQHTAGLDPLVNEFSESRFEFYRTKRDNPEEPFGTPTVVLNGRITPPLGGTVVDTQSRLETLKSAVDDLLSLTSDVTIELKATTFENTALEIKTSGLPTEHDDLRLHVIIAETLLLAPSRNGIQEHEMLVRGSATPIEGLPLESDVLNTTLDRNTLEASLADYVASLEKKYSITFPENATVLGPLKLVALIQNIKTGEILHAATANGP